MFERLKDDSQRLFRYCGVAMTYAPSREELEDRVGRLVSTAQANGIELAPLHYRQREGLNSALPLGTSEVDVERYMLTDEIAIQSPFATLELNEEGGGYYGQNRHSLNLVIANRKRLASPMGFVGGKPGSGKSFQTKREITNTRLAYPEDEIIILDPAQEFGPITEACGGRHVRLSPDSGNHLNPMGMADVSHQAEQLQAASKTEALIALCGASMADGDERQTDAERSIVSRCFGAALARARAEGARAAHRRRPRRARAPAGARGPLRGAAAGALRRGRPLDLQPPQQRRVRRPHDVLQLPRPARQHARVRHGRRPRVHPQPHVPQLRAWRDDLALRGRGPGPLRPPRHHRVPLAAVGGGGASSGSSRRGSRRTPPTCSTTRRGAP